MKPMLIRMALLLIAGLLSLSACQDAANDGRDGSAPPTMEERLAKYTDFTLTADLSVLTDNERAMIPLLIEAADLMDRAFWRQSYPGDVDSLLGALDDPALRRFVEINYGPWDRLADNEPFVDGVGPKPAGAGFYPADMTREEFDAAVVANPALRDLYTLVRRDAAGNLVPVPYREAFADLLQPASELLRQAAALAEDPGLKRYLTLRARALLDDDYQPSDLAWMDMKNNTIDVVIGPIETYEDKLYGSKAAFEAYVLVKDREWSRRLTRYAALLPGLQRGLPVPDAYKQESPGSDSDLGAYDVVYYAGDCNSGSKTIAINLPNDEEVQLQKGTRRLQLRNAMQAKFDKIMIPIADVLISEAQRHHVTFDAFFSNTMFHEVAHGLGIKNTINGRGTVRESLREQASALEEGKADVLGLFMVTRLHEQGEFGEADLMDFYVTFVAGIFRSIRFGAASAHAVANLVRFNYFVEQGAFVRDDASGAYWVDRDGMQRAIEALSGRILTLQGDGDYEGVLAFVDGYGKMNETLQADLDRLGKQGIPVDVTFTQGMDVLDRRVQVRRW